MNTTTDLTLEQKAALGRGASFWYTKPSDGAPGVFLSDGPHGVRAQKNSADALGIGESAPATCFPPAAGLAQSWDPELVERIGAALGREARALGVGVLLGPGVNIRRDPRGGRNFEYLSEDPHLSGALGSAWVRGVQSEGIGTSVKHFAANNAETDRLRLSSEVDQRTLREIYLRAFETVVRSAKPWTLMCSYNRINGVWASEDPWLLTRVLRDEWGFGGVVVSDWGAVRNRVASVAAGLDLQMPGGQEDTDRSVVEAVRSGRVDAAAVDASSVRVRELIRKAAASTGSGIELDLDENHRLAREAAQRSIVLLKNDGALLPLDPTRRIAVIGGYAQKPRFQGGGSSHVNATRVDVPLDEIRAVVGERGAIEFAAGYSTSGEPDGALLAGAVAAAGRAEVAVVFLALPDRDESEGYDREHIDLPESQLAVLRAIAAAQPSTVVVLSHGGVVRLAEVDKLARSILDGALLGQGGGRAVADVLFGIAEPGGRLTETVPERLQDAPSYLSFPGEFSRVVYGEGIFVGYRGYDARETPVTYPFGHGLSYTSFDYSDLVAESVDSALRVQLTVTNTGSRRGRDVVQLYVGLPDSRVTRAPKELRAFRSVELDSGESATVDAVIPQAELSYWDERVDDWVLESGSYRLSVGASSRDIRLTADVAVDAPPLRLHLSMQSTMGEVAEHPIAGPILRASMPQPEAAADDDELGADMARLGAAFPLDRIAMMGAGITSDDLAQLIDAGNGGL